MCSLSHDIGFMCDLKGVESEVGGGEGKVRRGRQRDGQSTLNESRKLFIDHDINYNQ